MDVVRTITSVETPVEEADGNADAQDTEVLAQGQDGTAEMGELPVEDWDYQRPRRGEVRDGTILAIREQEIIIDVGAKRDGIVPYADMQRMGPEVLETLSVGDQVPVYVLRPEDQDGNLLVSLFLARQAQAWDRAQELAEEGEAWEEQVVGFNKGGVVVPVGEIRGFVPASQIPGFPLGLSQEERLARLSTLVGETLQVTVIEINRRKRRLILSSTAAQKQWRDEQRERLLAELREGEVRKGVVSSVCNFGAFVDLGGADGLVHVSELSWRRVRHPREAVRVGEEVEVYVLRLDHERQRIGLSLKRLQPEPWALVEDKYELGQLIEGVVTNVVDFGAFAEVEDGVEGLIHVSELTDAQISHPREVVKKNDLLLLRIIRIDVRRKRLGLSLKRVLESEWAEWAAQLAQVSAQQEAEAEAAEPPAGEVEEQPETEVPGTGVAEPEPVEEPVAEVSEAEVEEPGLVEEPAAELPEAEVEEPEPVEQPVAEVPEAEVEEPGLVEEPVAELPEAEVAEPEPVEQAAAKVPEAEVAEPGLVEEFVAEVPGAEVEEPQPVEQAAAKVPEAEVGEPELVEEFVAEVPGAEVEEQEPVEQAAAAVPEAEVEEPELVEEFVAKVPEVEVAEPEPAEPVEEPVTEVPEAEVDEAEPAELVEEPVAEVPEAEVAEPEPAESVEEPVTEVPEAEVAEPEPVEQPIEVPEAEVAEAEPAAQVPEGASVGEQKGGDEATLPDADAQASEDAETDGEPEAAILQDPGIATVEA